MYIGDACVGKTALTQSFSTGGTTYPKNYLMVSISWLITVCLQWVLSYVILIAYYTYSDYRSGV